MLSGEKIKILRRIQDGSLTDVKQIWNDADEYKAFQSLRRAGKFSMTSVGDISPNSATKNELAKHAEALKQKAEQKAEAEARKEAEQKRMLKREWLFLGAGFILGIIASVIGSLVFNLIAH